MESASTQPQFLMGEKLWLCNHKRERSQWAFNITDMKKRIATLNCAQKSTLNSVYYMIKFWSINI